MKVAIIHDYIKEYGGAERVLEALHELWPKAPVFTTVYLPEFLGPHRNRFKNWDIRTSPLQEVPFNSKLISPARLIAPLLFRDFDFSKFDAVLVSQTGAYTPNIIKKKNAVQICYTHTPPRYLYGYATARDWKNNTVLRIIGEVMNHILRMVDFKSSQNVDYFIANSENTRKRIQKFYRRDAKVIYPPVEVQNLDVQKGDFFLAGGRIARPKHIDLIVKAFEKNGLPLKVFGRIFGGAEDLDSSKENIEFLGEISDSEKYRLMAEARAFVFASEDEDFGITPVEAQALGTPVVAYKSGGVLETVIDGKTGVLFDKLTAQSLNSAIERVGKMQFEPATIKKSAEKFSRDNFKKKINEFVQTNVKK